MEPLPQTETLIANIDKTIILLDSLRDFDVNLLFSETLQEIIDYQAELLSDLRKTDFAGLSSEHWRACNSLDEMKAFQVAIEGQLTSLFDWRPEFWGETSQFVKEIRKEQTSFIRILKVKFPDMEADQEKKLKIYYRALSLEIISIRSEVLKILEKWNRMNPNSKKLNETNQTPNITSKFRITPDHKTDFIKILSAMYDCRMFQTDDGYFAKNKQELMNEFGRLLGEDFSNYSASLSQCKRFSIEKYIKPFDYIRQKAEEYYDK